MEGHRREITDKKTLKSIKKARDLEGNYDLLSLYKWLKKSMLNDCNKNMWGFGKVTT